ncbi:MAG: RNB domain-containing ribonuclease, partial [bacterium]|nr:RNB domain-containing ribonuclease [bacterium]
ADVSHYVRPGSALDDEARRRATSIYLVDRTIPMLPEVLSNDVCSLVPHEERLTFGAVFTLNQASEIVNEWFGRTIIKSDHRFSYEEAQASLDGKSDKYATELKNLNELAYKLREQKVDAGAITFDDTEVKFILDAKGKPVEVVQKVRTDSHLLIEDFMLLANKRVAEFASKYNEHQPHTFIYRVHDWPNIEKLGNLANFLKPLGYELSLAKDRLHSSDLNQLLATAAERAESHIVNRAAIRAMAKAVYSTENIGHWGLAFLYYTHFTSPIRRWPDVLVHRLLTIFLTKKKPTLAMLKSVSEDVISASAREGEAAEAERESIKYKQVEYMSAHIGEQYEGIISGAAEFGLFVEELSTKAEGLVPVRDLDDYYDYDEKTISLIGRKTKKRYRLGDKIKIKIKAADPARRRLDFSLVE